MSISYVAINLTFTLARGSAFTAKWLLRLDFHGYSPTHKWVAVNIKLIATYDVNIKMYIDSQQVPF